MVSEIISQDKLYFILIDNGLQALIMLKNALIENPLLLILLILIVLFSNSKKKRRY